MAINNTINTTTASAVENLLRNDGTSNLVQLIDPNTGIAYNRYMRDNGAQAMLVPDNQIPTPLRSNSGPTTNLPLRSNSGAIALSWTTDSQEAMAMPW